MADLTWLAEAIAGPIIEKLLEVGMQEVVKCINVRNDLKQLQITMVKVQEMLKKYEGRDCQDQKNLLQQLHRLNEAMYNAEDIIDDIRQRRQLEADSHSSSSGQVRLPSCSCPNFFPDLLFRYRIGCRIGGIRAEIEDVLTEIQKEMSTQSACKDRVNSGIQLTDLYPSIVSDDIIGLEDETANLVNILTRGSNRKIENTVYAIVGIPGVGKTTLAKMVYNSLETDNHFDKKIWLCIGSEDHQSHVLKKALFETFNKNYDEQATEVSNFKKIEEMVMNKRLLIVLDNCWTSDVWMKFLRTPVSKAAEGSAVLVTTRNREVADGMRALGTFDPRLSAENAWLLLRKEVFGDGREESVEQKHIGEELVEKCKRVPLAIKAIAGVIRSRGVDMVGVWREVCQSNIWSYVCEKNSSNDDSLPGEIMPALMLSYLDLPYHLKLCFCHCSFFPKNFVFHHPGLVQHWIAEGFVPSRQGEDMDNKGTEYYRALISRNLLQSEASYFDGKGSIMHDIMHQLGRYVHTQRFVKTSTKTRHLYKVEQSLSDVPDINKDEAGYLRTLVLSKNPIRSIRPNYLEKLHRLRVLDMSYTAICKLPDSIGELVHLRLLNLSFTRLETLPGSIGKLKCLQSLQLNGSKCLKELPKEIVELRCLTCLLIETAKVDHLPLELGKVEKLRRLNGFLVNEDACNVEGLRNLSGLTELTMYKLERLTSKEESLDYVLLNKSKLTHLHLSCNPECNEQEPSVSNIEKVFEKLHPPRNCVTIHIDHYFGKAFPTWMSTLPFNDLKWLRLENCQLVQQLPPLGQLHKLKVLDIRNNSAVNRIGSEFISTLKFPRLEELYFIGLSGLRKWSGFVEGAFPCLKKLEIVRCPELKQLPNGMDLLTSLRELIVEEADKLREIKDHPSVLTLRIRRNSKLKQVCNLPKVHFMRIRRCSYLANMTDLTSLRHLVLSDHRMISLPEWLKSMTSLKRLDLEVNKTLLVQVYNELTESFKFKHIDHVELKCCSAEERDQLQNRQGQNAENPQTLIEDSDLYVSYTKAPYSYVSNLDRYPSIINNGT